MGKFFERVNELCMLNKSVFVNEAQKRRAEMPFFLSCSIFGGSLMCLAHKKASLRPDVKASAMVGGWSCETSSKRGQRRLGESRKIYIKRGLDKDCF